MFRALMVGLAILFWQSPFCNFSGSINLPPLPTLQPTSTTQTDDATPTMESIILPTFTPTPATGQPSATPTAPQTTTSEFAWTGFVVPYKNNVNLRGGPSTSYTIVDSLPYGKGLPVIGGENGWYKVAIFEQGIFLHAAWVSGTVVKYTPFK